MTRRRKTFWLGVLGVVAVAVGIVIHDRFMAGPVYNGAPLNVWLRLLDDPLPQTRDKARDAIRHLGPAATPSEDNDYRRRLQEYHSLVMETITSGHLPDSTNQPARIH